MNLKESVASFLAVPLMLAALTIMALAEGGFKQVVKDWREFFGIFKE